jgi:hypothetical protein
LWIVKNLLLGHFKGPVSGSARRYLNKSSKLIHYQ